MIIRMYPIVPQRGNEHIAQGIALGKGCGRNALLPMISSKYI